MSGSSWHLGLSRSGNCTVLVCHKNNNHLVLGKRDSLLKLKLAYFPDNLPFPPFFCFQKLKLAARLIFVHLLQILKGRNPAKPVPASTSVEKLNTLTSQ